MEKVKFQLLKALDIKMLKHTSLIGNFFVKMKREGQRQWLHETAIDYERIPCLNTCSFQGCY